MKHFIFLYPIKRYMEEFVMFKYHFEHKDCEGEIEHLNKIIDTRYRQKGYQVNWLFFSKGDSQLDLYKPDLDNKSKYMDFHDNDMNLVNKVTFDKHVKEKFYPDNEFIMKQVFGFKSYIKGKVTEDNKIN
ncbi:hypothetical protein ACFL1H_06400 [Nanoarchaeota archaeon]